MEPLERMDRIFSQVARRKQLISQETILFNKLFHTQTLDLLSWSLESKRKKKMMLDGSKHRSDKNERRWIEFVLGFSEKEDPTKSSLVFVLV